MFLLRPLELGALNPSFPAHPPPAWPSGEPYWAVAPLRVGGLRWKGLSLPSFRRVWPLLGGNAGAQHHGGGLLTCLPAVQDARAHRASSLRTAVWKLGLSAEEKQITT